MINPQQLEAFLKQRFGPVKRGRGKHGLELITRCPVCGKRKLSISASTGMYQCWRGCISGHIDRLLGDVRLAKINVFEKSANAPTKRELDIPGELVPLTSLSDDHQAIVYLSNRGFNPKELDAQYGIRYCASGKRYANGLYDTTNTLIIPVYINGIVEGWQSRLLYNPDTLDTMSCEALGFIQDEDGDWVRPPKYFTVPGLDKGKILWNTDWARQSRIVVVCEGVFDAISVGRCAVAAFGKGVTEVQANILKAYWDLVIVLLDPGDGDVQAMRLYEALDAGSVPAVCIKLRGYKDAGEAPRAEIWRQIDEAVSNNQVLASAGRTLDTYKFLI